MTITRTRIDSRIISDADFHQRFSPVKNHLNPHAPFDGCMFETFGAELDFVRTQDPALVWTIIDCGGTMTIESGCHFVNRLGYLVASNPRPDDCLYSVGDEEAESNRLEILPTNHTQALRWLLSELHAGNTFSEETLWQWLQQASIQGRTVTVSRSHLRSVLDYLHESEADHYGDTVENYPEDVDNHVYRHVLAIEAQLTDAPKAPAPVPNDVCCELAHTLTVRECGVRGLPIDAPDTDDTNETVYAEKAQHIFDEVYRIVSDVLAPYREEVAR